MYLVHHSVYQSLDLQQLRQLSLKDRTFNLAFKMKIDYEQAKVYRKANGGYLRGGQWNDLYLEVNII